MIMLTTHSASGQFTCLLSCREPFPCAGVGSVSIHAVRRCSSGSGLIPLAWSTGACTPISMSSLCCCTSLEEIWESHLGCVSIATEAWVWIPNFDRAVPPQSSANICTVLLLCCFPRRKAADGCPSMETQGRDSGGALGAELRGPKDLILNLRAAVPRGPVKVRIQHPLRGRRFWIPSFTEFPEVYPKETELQSYMLHLKLDGRGSEGQLLWAFTGAD